MSLDLSIKSLAPEINVEDDEGENCDGNAFSCDGVDEDGL